MTYTLKTTSITTIEPNKDSFQQILYFWVGQVISLLGSAVVQFSIIWWITETTQNSVYVGLTVMMGYGPMVLVLPFSGVIVDRWNRKKIIFTLDFLQMLTMIILFYLFYYDLVNITSLLIILAFRGGLQGFHQNAVSSIIPSMVPKDKLSNYNALSSLSNGLTEFIGPIVGAILLGVLGLENIERIFLIDVVTFCIALIPLVIITIPVISKKSKQSFYKDFKEGVSFIRKTQGLQSLLMLLVSLNLLGGFVFVGIPLIVSRDTLINGDHKTYGITMAFFSFGILITAVFLSVKKIFKNSVSGNFIGMYIAISGAYIMTLACFLKSQYVLFASTFLIGAGICVNNTNSMTIWHSVVPNELQGRVFSVRIPIVYSALTISMLYSGFLIAWYDIRFLLLIISILATLIITFTYLFSDLRNVDTSKIASDLGKELNDK